jgi:hypothetical protein
MAPSYIAKYDTARIFLALSMLLLIAGCNGEDFANTINNDNVSSDLNTLENKALYDVSLSWTAPSQRENNEPISLSEIAGYKVYIGTSQSTYVSSINIENGSADSYTFRNLSSGTYYFALTTYDTAGRESQLSAEVKIVV